MLGTQLKFLLKLTIKYSGLLLILLFFTEGCTTLPSQRKADPDKLLLKIVNHNNFKDSPVAMHWGDISDENRYVIHYNVPAEAVDGGINFVNPYSFLAVNDAFMANLNNFIISFWFKVHSDHPRGLNTNGNGGVLMCSNWAMKNNGDWLVGFDMYGSLIMLLQNPDVTLKSKITRFNRNETYFVEIHKTRNNLILYINEELQDSKKYPYRWPENGVPLTIGGNPNDRHGMGFFNGVIGDIKITTRRK